jgi:hypothetical protein
MKAFRCKKNLMVGAVDADADSRWAGDSIIKKGGT